MGANVSFAPNYRMPFEKCVANEQLNALFGAVTISVCGGGIAASVLVASLHHLGAVKTSTGLSWAGFIILCAAAHILLSRAYWKAHPAGDQWHHWALWFTMIGFIEGLGWGWAPIGLATADHADAMHLTFLIVGGVAAAAVPGFSSYLPAFFSFYLPATLGCLWASLNSADAVQQAAFPAMVVFVAATGSLGIQANRSFKQLVGERFRTEELAVDLQQQKVVAEQANLAKSTFLAAASHDLRQPVHALGLLVGALRSMHISPEAQHLLEQIETSSNAMDSLFTALLDISRLDAGVVSVCRRCFAIGPLLERICLDYAEEAKAKGILLVQKRCGLFIDSDPLLVERIVRNLVSNAVRYTDCGRILVGCRRRDTCISIQVWDTGRGIPFEQQDLVFREYYQLGNTERDRTKGLGLGLAIVRRLTDLLDCRLTLCSQPGRGTCFKIEVPVSFGAPLAVEVTPEQSSGVFFKGFIVVIDDELAIREAMSSLLTNWGHEVVTAGSGDEALQRLANYRVKPNLIICDYRLRDGENGVSVIERLRTDYNEPIPAMLITGDTAPDRLADAQASGLLLLHKPVSNSRLRAAIINLIADALADSNEEELTTVR